MVVEAVVLEYNTMDTEAFSEGPRRRLEDAVSVSQMAVSVNWVSFLWVSSKREPSYLGSILRPLNFGNSQMEPLDAFGITTKAWCRHALDGLFTVLSSSRIWECAPGPRTPPDLMVGA